MADLVDREVVQIPHPALLHVRPPALWRDMGRDLAAHEVGDLVEHVDHGGLEQGLSDTAPRTSRAGATFLDRGRRARWLDVLWSVGGLCAGGVWSAEHRPDQNGGPRDPGIHPCLWHPFALPSAQWFDRRRANDLPTAEGSRPACERPESRGLPLRRGPGRGRQLRIVVGALIFRCISSNSSGFSCVVGRGRTLSGLDGGRGNELTPCRTTVSPRCKRPLEPVPTACARSS